MVNQKGAAFKVGTDGCLLGAWANPEGCQRILDIGSGTGVIALMLAQRNPQAYIDAVEADPQSAWQTRENFENAPWANRMTVYSQTFQDFAAERNYAQYDLIVSNPPYFSNSTKNPDGRKRMARHTDSLGAAEVFTAGSLLKPEGKIALVTPFLEFMQLKHAAGLKDFALIRHCLVTTRAGKPVERILTEWGRFQEEGPREALCIYQADGTFTEGFGDLLRDFYLKL